MSPRRLPYSSSSWRTPLRSSGLPSPSGASSSPRLTKQPVFDGAASIIIGIILTLVALVLFYETKSLLIGEGVSAADMKRIKAAIATVPEVKEVVNVLTMHLGPEEILVNLDINFANGLSTDQVEQAIDKVEQAIRKELPAVKKIFVEAESLKGAARGGGGRGEGQ